MNRWPVLVTRSLPRRPMDAILERCDADVWDGPPEAIPRDDLLKRIGGKAGAVTLLTEKVDAEFLDAAGPQLRIVANYAVGFDNIDVEECTRRGVLATNTPEVLTETTADLAWALLMAAARRIAEGDRFLRSRTPWIWGPEMLLGRDVHDVFEREPEVHPDLLELDNAVVVPHLGSATVATRDAMGMLAAENLLAGLEGRRPPTLLNPDAWRGA